MEICFNGAPQEISDGTTISAFLAERNLRPAEVVAEVNDEILGPDDIGRLLRPQDRLNAFRIVAGG